MRVLVIIMIFLFSVSCAKEEKKAEVFYNQGVDIQALKKEPLLCSSVKPVVYSNVPSLKGLPLKERKEVFIKIMLPSILIAEKRILKERSRVESIMKRMASGESLDRKEVDFLNNLMEKYKAKSADELLIKLKTNPPSVVLAQAAVESGWGTSRFFTLANNPFGIWTWKKNEGIKVGNASVWLRKYSNLLQATEDYMYNMNVGWAYKRLRMARQKTNNPVVLVSYLKRYSIQGSRYTEKLRSVIINNNLRRYDQCTLSE